MQHNTYQEKYKEIQELFLVQEPEGYSKEEMEKVKQEVGELPPALEYFYTTYGKTEELLHLQDEFILPNRYEELVSEDYLVFFNENQGICHAGLKKEDAMLPDPPVYVQMDEEDWNLASDSVSDFLVAMYGYQASLCLEYSPEEFYFIEEEEKEIIEEKFPKRKEYIASWLDDFSVYLYGDNNSGRIALMEQEEDGIQMNYAANSQEEYDRMQEMLQDIGEAI